MFNFPFLRFPYLNYYYPYYNKYTSLNKTYSENHTYDNNLSKKKKQSTLLTHIPKNYKYDYEKKNNSKNGNSDAPVFEIFGIMIYMDDLIILVLLFLLYKEEVKDEILFIALIILLLS